MDNQTPLCRYTYDPLDRLSLSAQTGQPISQCFYQAGQLQGEVQGSANRMLMRHGNQLLAQRDQTQGQTDQQLLASDRQHSVLHAAGRRSQNAIAYSPYGHRATDSGLTQLANFTGERLDPVTGHYLLGNGYRSFNPALMRFNTPDSFSPFGEGGLNAYAYCLGDPVNYRDPDGHVPGWLWPVAGIALSIVGIVASAGAFAAVTPALGATGFAAQWGALTAAAKVSVGLSVASGVTGVGSGAASLAEPESSTGSILGYVSLGLGVVSAVAGGAAALGSKLSSNAAKVGGRFGSGAGSRTGSINVAEGNPIPGVGSRPPSIGGASRPSSEGLTLAEQFPDTPMDPGEFLNTSQLRGPTVRGSQTAKTSRYTDLEVQLLRNRQQLGRRIRGQVYGGKTPDPKYNTGTSSV